MERDVLSGVDEEMSEAWADRSIPYCRHERKEAGFTITVSRARAYTYTTLGALPVVPAVLIALGIVSVGSYHLEIYSWLALVALLAGALYLLLMRCYIARVRVHVTPATVTVNGRSYPRAQFAGLHCEEETVLTHRRHGPVYLSLTVLAYRAAGRRHRLPGVWGNEDEALAVVRAFNSQLRGLPACRQEQAP